jgi:hypothetical protein
MTKPSKRKRLVIALALLALSYLISYFIISRRGYSEADRLGLAGFYYLTPEDSDSWRWKNYGCVVIFYPVNLVDQWLGTGRAPAKEPLFHLSK